MSSTTTTPALSIREVSERTGFAESTLRYYERVGLVDAVRRDEVSGHRRYEEVTVRRLEALACLRATGVGIADMRTYLRGLDLGHEGIETMVSLFDRHAQALDEEMTVLAVRRRYVASKADLWRARRDRDVAGEAEALRRTLDATSELRAPR